jgi:hypothetical protein
MIAVIILYNVVLPSFNTAMNQGNLTPTDTAWSNLSTANRGLSLVIPTLLITIVIVYTVRGMLG